MSSTNQDRATMPASASNEATTWCGERVSDEVSQAKTLPPPPNDLPVITAATTLEEAILACC